ncbi:MAG: efflux RND transporter periplasmic adaptor subunit [Phycisphaerae bacterium]|nr:efflux RND transporter periplasmic adaptor subunit [Phycisphaerae bacterium]
MTFRNPNTFGASLCLILATLSTGCDNKNPEPAKALSATAPTSTTQSDPRMPAGQWVVVSRRPVRQSTSAVGSFRARQTTLLGSQVSGRVEKVLVDVGDAVRTGQELVQLDPTFFAIEVEQREADAQAAEVKLAGGRETLKAIEAEVQVAKTAVAESELEHTRMKNLWEKPPGETPSIPKQRYDAARFGFEQSRARLQAAQSRVAEQAAKLREHEAGVKQAKEALHYAKERLDETIIRAPYDAIVARRLVDPGEPVTATPVTHLLEVQEVGTLYLEYSLPQELLSAVKPGTRVTFDAEGVSEEVEETRSTIGIVYPTLDEATRSFRCRSLVINPKLTFRPGMLTRVEIVTGESEPVLAVPRLALERSSRGWAVKVSNDGHGVERYVEIGAMDETWAEVRSGLVEGDRILVPEPGTTTRPDQG